MQSTETTTIDLGNGTHAIIDTSDYDQVITGGPWHAHHSRRTIYAQRNVERDGIWGTEYLHQFLTGHPMTDHKDSDGLNNQRANLRAATHSQNGANRRVGVSNTSGFKGVYSRGKGRWQAQIRQQGKRFTLGTHATAADAAMAYDRAAVRMFGEFANTNYDQNGSQNAF